MLPRARRVADTIEGPLRRRRLRLSGGPMSAGAAFAFVVVVTILAAALAVLNGPCSPYAEPAAEGWEQR